MICPSCGAENREEARFCDSCGATLADAPARAQRKVVTVLFCDVTGSTALGERLDPEALRGVMSRYFDVARVAIERHGGTLEKFIGDAVMAVFGVPVVCEDDALRAVRAAQELRDAVEIDVRIGVNTGEVVTGTGDSLVTGDAVNVAARLEQAAASGEVLIGAETYRLVRDAVDVDLLPPLEARGKSEPLSAYRLRAVTGDIAVARRVDAALVGRDRERRLLADAWERCRSERACLLFTILGSAGVGKSRLGAEFVAEIEATVVRGRCLSYGEGITYWPAVEVVMQLLAGEPPPNAELAALLGDGQAPADEIAYAVRKLFEAKAAERPLLVVLDDLQWAEPTFLDLVEHVADWSRDAPILLLCLARPDLFDRRPGWAGGKLNATSVLLEPLSAAETDLLIDELLGGDELASALRERIRVAADGNPLFVEQMLAMLEESPGAVAVPSTIQALLAARLDQLPASERAALERGAVEGQVFHRSAVAALDGDPASLPPLVRKELVRPSAATVPGEDAFRFRHLLIRDAAYDALPKTERAALHERFAAWLEERAPDLVELDEILGYHLEQAARYRVELGSPSSELGQRAARRLTEAGLRAQERGDAGAAVSLLGRVTSLLDDDDPERLAVLPVLGRALVARGELGAAHVAFDEAIAKGDVDVSAVAFFDKIHTQGHADGMSPFEMEQKTQAMLDRVLPAASDQTLVEGYLTLAWARFWDGRNAAAVEAGEQALEHATRTGDSRSMQAALQITGSAKWHGNAPMSEIERQLGLQEAAGIDLSAPRNSLLAHRGEFEQSRLLGDAYTEKLRERGNTVQALAMEMSQALYVEWAGDLGSAEERLWAAWEGLGAIGERGFRAMIGVRLGHLLARSGRYDEADTILNEAAAICPPADFVAVCGLDYGRALVASGRGERARALKLARKAVDLADSREYLTMQHECWYAYGQVLRAADQNDEARAAFEHARDIAERKGFTFLVGRCDAELAAPPAPAPPA